MTTFRTIPGDGLPDLPLAPRIGLFDIMQMDPITGDDPGAMYRVRLDDLALADELGISVAFAAERHFLPTYACPSATTWLAAASQRTTRIRLGVLAYTLPIRAPVQLAEEIAVLDWLSNGRVEIGMGLGHRVEELAALGVDPTQRVTLFQERLALLRGLWSGGEVSFERGDVRLRKVTIAPLSVQEPHPPLWFAGTDPGAAHWMGAQGMGLAVGFKSTADLQPAVAAFMAGRANRTPEVIASEPPHRSGSIALMRSVVVGDSEDRVRAEITDDLVRIGEKLGPDGVTLAERRDAARAQIDAMIRNEVMFAGSPEQVAEGILRAKNQLPFDLLLANVYAMGASRERIQTSIRLLAGPVTERCRQAIPA